MGMMGRMGMMQGKRIKSICTTEITEGKIKVF
jgi:hypothetical protein